MGGHGYLRRRSVGFLCGLLVIACALSSAALAQTRPLDITGLWRRDDGGVVKISQDGEKLKATHVELSVEVRDVFGFRPGDEHLVGVLQGRTVRGKMFTHLPVDWKLRCPEQWAGLADIELTVSEDGNTIEGRWKWDEVTDKGCHVIRQEWRPRRYARAQPTPNTGPGHLSVVTRGAQLTTLRLELILDASGSMNERVEGRRKIDTAKEAMTQIIKGLPDDAQVALRIYGHRIPEGRKGDCQDSELAVPFGKIDKARMLSRVAGIKALGTTPIDYSLRQVARDFGSVPGEKMVILVTDGKEECGGSPSTAVSELLSKGLKLQVNIVGFALEDEATKWELQRVAEFSGGRFFDAMDATGLRAAIEQALAAPYDVLDATGKKMVAGGRVGQLAVDVPEGIYTVVVQAAGKPITIPNVRIAQNGSTKIVLKKEGQEVGIQVLGP